MGNSVIAVLRQWVIVMVLCGLLVPVVSTTDDAVLLSAAVQPSSSGPSEIRGRITSSPDDSSALFWAQFEHMDCPVLPLSLPEIGRAGTVALIEPALASLSVPNGSVRGPPAVFAA